MTTGRQVAHGSGGVNSGVVASSPLFRPVVSLNNPLGLNKDELR